MKTLKSIVTNKKFLATLAVVTGIVAAVLIVKDEPEILEIIADDVPFDA